MAIDQTLLIFIQESRELLDDMERCLLEIEQGQVDAESINAIFRAAHTIKGSSGLFGLDDIVAFTHVVEGVLDDVRNGSIAIDSDLKTLLLQCGDQIRNLVDAVESESLGQDAEMMQRSEALAHELQSRYGRSHATENTQAASQAVSTQEGAGNGSEGNGSEGNGSDDCWHISVKFGKDVLRNGMDPMSFLRYLQTLGTIVGIITLHQDICTENVDEFDPESCYLGFEIAFRSRADKAAIENVFEFVRDDCTLQILPPQSQISEYIRLIQALPDEHLRLGEMLVRNGVITVHELEAALQKQSGKEAVQPIGAILIEQGAASPKVVDAALVKQSRSRETKATENSSVRVDADKLDHLINLVGELITVSASANLIAKKAGNSEMQECGSLLSRLVEEVRNSALQLRMVKIGNTFNRFQRVVHDVSRELGKDIGLTIDGEDTELDKTVVEKITDPLTHLIRNAMDHGIEPADVRAARGKPVRGSIGLNAYHDSGTIVIEVTDDGGGLKKDRILAKAMERGLVEPGKSLSDSDIFNLIFEPGFSTAEQVTNISGRGVGMDVVKRNIQALRGNVNLSSIEEVGTIVTIRLPLTLAIIDGFQVGIGKSVFVLPLDMVEECVEYSAVPGHDYANLRGEVLPFIRLRDLFDIQGSKGMRQSIVVVKYAGQRAGLVVDSLLGESQTVIKPLGEIFQHLKCISGSSILGSGEVALILDVPALLAQVNQDAGHAREKKEYLYAN